LNIEQKHKSHFKGTFVPIARITEHGSQSIITDYLGTPAQMYDEQGQVVWEANLDIYGRVRTFVGSSLSDCPFRYQGQYQDEETGLYYNRFRYYDPSIGAYLSQDPIGLAGKNPTIYGYVKDVNSWIDVFGLDIIRLRHYTNRSGLNGIQESMIIKAGDQGSVFAVRAKGKPLSMIDAEATFKIKRGHGRDYIDFDMDDSKVEFRKNDLGVKEYKIKGDIALDSKTTSFNKRH
jgi:type VI secretion system protein VasG